MSDQTDVLRAPPCNYDAERALLGAILLNNRAHERVADFLDPEHFADPVNGRIYQACEMLIAQSAQANPVTLKTHLERDELVMSAGGIKYLASLAASAVTIINAGDYGKLIYDLYLRRELIAIGEHMVNEAFESGPDPSAFGQIEQAEQQLYSLGSRLRETSAIIPFDRAVDNTLTEWEAYSRDGDIGVPSGLRDLDELAGTMQAQDLIIIGGRPSAGKTALAMTIAKNAAEAERRAGGKRQVLFFSLEMSRNQLVNRLITAETGVVSPRRRKDAMTSSDWGAVIEMKARNADLPLTIDETGGATLSMMRAVARRVQRKTGLRLIVVDYLQLMGIERGLRLGSDVEKVTYLSAGLKALAKALDVPVLALSQLSRNVEQREDKRPQLSDLRQSGSIEQDADTVMFCYRDYYYLERKVMAKRESESNEHFQARVEAHDSALATSENTAEIIVAKARHGEIGRVLAYFDGPRTWFADLINIKMGVPTWAA